MLPTNLSYISNQLLEMYAVLWTLFPLGLRAEIFLDLSSQKKPSYRLSNNCILIQDLDTN